MTEEQYRRISAPFRTEKAAAVLRWTDRLLTLGVYTYYILCVLMLGLRLDTRCIALLLICGIPFCAVSLFRKKLNAPRPYEVFSIEPIIRKDTKGQSFPSRHVFSVFVIAAASWIVSPWYTLMLCIAGVILAAVRVIGGVHHPRDVIAGALIGLSSGGVGIALTFLFH